MNGLRKPNSSVSAETPAIRRPRCWICAMNEPAGILPGRRQRPDRRDTTRPGCRSRGAARRGTVVVVGDGRRAPTSERSDELEHDGARPASTRDRSTTIARQHRRLIGTPAVAGRCRARSATAAATPASEQQPGQRGQREPARESRSSARLAASSSSASRRHAARTRRTHGWPRRFRSPPRRPRPTSRRRRACARRCARRGTRRRRSTVGGGLPSGCCSRSAAIARSRRRTPILNRSSNGWPEPRSMSVRLSALLASKPSMRAVASATVCRYGAVASVGGRRRATRP